MGIKKFSWKKIGGIVFIIAAVLTIATNLKFVWNCLEFLGNLGVKIFAPLANSIVRDVILLFLIVGILILLFLINRRIKRTLIATTEERLTTGEKPEVGTYKCTNCGTIVRLDDPDDTLPPCPKCCNTEFLKVIVIKIT